MDPIRIIPNANYTNVSVSSNVSGSSPLSNLRQVDFKADAVLRKLGSNENFRPYVCKVIMAMPESMVDSYVEIAVRNAKISVAKYFATITAKELGLGRWKSAHEGQDG